MKTRLVLRPGQKGTRKLVTLYGRKLVCVRYRYDETLGRRWKTAEIIVEEATWAPKPPRPGTLVNVKAGFDDKDLIRRIKEAGGRWNSKQAVWRLSYEKAVSLGVEKWIFRRIA